MRQLSKYDQQVQSVVSFPFANQPLYGCEYVVFMKYFIIYIYKTILRTLRV